MVSSEEWVKTLKHVKTHSNVLFIPSNRSLEDLAEFPPEETTIISSVGMNIGLGNLRMQYGMATWFDHIFSDSRKIAVTAEFAHVTPYENFIVQRAMDLPYRRMVTSGDLSFLTFEAFMKARGMTGYRATARELAKPVIFSAYADNIGRLAKAGARIIVAGAHEVPIDYISSRFFGHPKIVIGNAAQDTIEKPGYGSISLNWFILPPFFLGSQGEYQRFDGYRDGEKGIHFLERQFGKKNIETALFLPFSCSMQRGELFEKRVSEIERIVSGYTSPIKVAVFPCGGGMKEEDVKKIIRDLASAVTADEVELSILGTSSDLIKTVEAECQTRGVNIEYIEGETQPAKSTYFRKGTITIVRNPNATSKDKIELINHSYSMLGESHLSISPPGEMPLYAGLMGVYTLLMPPKSWTEKINGQNYASQKIAESIGERDIGFLIKELFTGEQRVKERMKLFLEKGCNAPYLAPGEALKKTYGSFIPGTPKAI
jgi:hypothetical protein